MIENASIVERCLPIPIYFYVIKKLSVGQLVEST
jgi:hypothetical protein